MAVTHTPKDQHPIHAHHRQGTLLSDSLRLSVVAPRSFSEDDPPRSDAPRPAERRESIPEEATPSVLPEGLRPALPGSPPSPGRCSGCLPAAWRRSLGRKQHSPFFLLHFIFLVSGAGAVADGWGARGGRGSRRLCVWMGQGGQGARGPRGLLPVITVPAIASIPCFFVGWYVSLWLSLEISLLG